MSDDIKVEIETSMDSLVPSNEPYNEQEHDERRVTPPTKIRLEYLDGLRGILCLIVVVHHFRCGFDPCGVFGASAKWLTDPNICIGATTFVFLAPLVNGTFSVAVFFVMSGTVLSNGLAMAEDNRWRLTVVKRYFRLLLPCAAASIFAYVLGGTMAPQEAGALTGSKWLIEMSSERPAPAALFNQIIFGIWHNGSTLNNSFWTMSIELFGSFVVFGLVAVLKGCTPTVSKRFLAGLFICLLVPSATMKSNVNIELEWQRNGDTAEVLINPYYHANLLQTLGTLSLSMKDTAPDKWYDKDPEEDPLKKKKKLNNDGLISELFHSHATNSYDRMELVRTKEWETTNPFIWYATFVAGVWITEHNLRLGGPKSLKNWQTGLLVLVTYICATYPLMGFWMTANPVWRVMKSLAGNFGLGFASFILYYIIGAVCLVQLVVSTPRIRKFLSSPICRWFGQISFSLYLTHIPIIYTLSTNIFLFLQGPLSMSVASCVAFVLTFPVMLGIAVTFEHFIDKPSLIASANIGKYLLGMVS
jgi:peptidoglycan/LPS O-acetylase OafA/YrhL